MKNKIVYLTVVITLLCSTHCLAQNKPLNGSGNVVTKLFEYNNFNSLDIAGLAGNINVEVGKPFSVTVKIDDNLAPLLRVNERNGQLKIELEGNNNNRLYVEETNISITITMPLLKEVKHHSNSSITINGITGPYFRIKNNGNGEAVLKGNAMQLDIICRGNGSVKAAEMNAAAVKVVKSGNGNVYIKTDTVFTATGSGNGNVINTGAGQPDQFSGISGNGKIKTNNLPVKKRIPKNE